MRWHPALLALHTAIHELGHYWFGDVVTCRWWEDIWLNEALTSWLDQQLTNELEPTWNYALDGQAKSAEFAFHMDSLSATPPVRKPITTNDDIIGSFDNVCVESERRNPPSVLEFLRSR